MENTPSLKNSGENVSADTPPALLSSILARAMSHPTRVGALVILLERDATPAEIAAELEEPLSNVSYHVDVLEELGCIELVGVQPAYGGRVVKHVYRATKRAYVDADAWEQFGEREKVQLTTMIMQLASEDVSDAMVARTFFDPDDNHLSRTPMTVDREGWEEATTLLNETLERLLKIEAKAAARIAGGGQHAMPMKILMFQFRSPTKH